ncbi:MAG: glucosamine-6-phosphate deaminase [Rhodothermaceae bacterium]|nr:glucosamine-6-phosphate deaminase [Rhodothermaceae bacterium]
MIKTLSDTNHHPEAGTQLEKVPVRIFEDPSSLAEFVANYIQELVESKKSKGENLVLGLPTGSTPIGVYQRLIELHQEGSLDFSNVITFNLDEYYPIEPHALQSYHRFMHENLFDHVNIPKDQIHIPDGMVPRSKLQEYCRTYDQTIKEAGGLDLVLLGIGRSGHIGFNEPGSSLSTRTRLITLDEITRKDASSSFFGDENVPREAITMGVGTILEAKEIILMATGEHKAVPIRRTVELEDPNKLFPASFLQRHQNVSFMIDEPASSELTRVKIPWLVKDVNWTDQLTKKAVVWLSEKVDKAILRLDSADFFNNRLHSLVYTNPNVDTLCRTVFEDLRKRIVYQDYLFKNKRVICFSPHPDDDVISMGGMLDKVVANQNDVTVAYMTNGSVAVFDSDVRRYLKFVEMSMEVFGMDQKAVNHFQEEHKRILDFIENKTPGEIDLEVVQKIKAFIRYSEAIAGIEVIGLGPKDARFLDMPFYKTGTVRKDPISEADVQVVLNLLNEIKPHHIFVAGDLSDPHGTHRMCYMAIGEALTRYRMQQGIVDPEALRVTPEAIHYAPAAEHQPLVWLYRGAWQEWEIDRADVFIPMSKADLDRKIEAVFKHESQKDRAMFPGAYDTREFWERARDRNRATADALNKLGLPEFYVAEAYVTCYAM